ncbi:glycosyltransferase family 2 protein [Halorubrum ezzemoulense]|nr:glycosyltransferase family 2 protein [Halorubrum ezzemoulense]
MSSKVGLETDLDVDQAPSEKQDLCVSVLVPAYNEQGNIEELTERVVSVLDSHYTNSELLFVDDGSADDTGEVLERLREKYGRVRVIRFWQNFGKANALSAGFDNVSGDVVVTMDADLQDDPKAIPDLVDELEEGYDLISGWRRDRQSPFFKRLSSKLYNGLTARLTGLELHDLNCGMKAYRREVLQKVDVYGGMHRYIPVMAYWAGFRVGEMVVPHHERKHGKSKYSTRRLVFGFFDLLSVTFLTKHSKAPLRLFGGLGTVFSAAGFSLGIYLLVLKYGFGQGIGNRPLLMLSMLLIITGLQVFSFGFLAEKLSAQDRIDPYYEER